MSEREEKQKRGAGRDRVSAIEQVEHSVPAAAILIGWAFTSTTLLADMHAFLRLLPDVLEDLCSPANLRYQARSLLARNGQKRN